MLKRNENGKLTVNSLDLDIFIEGLFYKCKTEHEVEWVSEILQSCVECRSEDRLTELEEEEE